MILTSYFFSFLSFITIIIIIGILLLVSVLVSAYCILSSSSFWFPSPFDWCLPWKHTLAPYLCLILPCREPQNPYSPSSQTSYRHIAQSLDREIGRYNYLIALEFGRLFCREACQISQRLDNTTPAASRLCEILRLDFFWDIVTPSRCWNILGVLKPPWSLLGWFPTLGYDFSGAKTRTNKSDHLHGWS